MQPRPDIPFDPGPLAGLILKYYNQIFSGRTKEHENLQTIFRYLWSIIESRYENKGEAIKAKYTTGGQILTGGAIQSEETDELLKELRELATDANCIKSTDPQIDEYIKRDSVERLKVAVNQDNYGIYLYARGLHEVEIPPSRLDRYKAYLRRRPVEPLIVPKCKSLFMAVLEKSQRKKDETALRRTMNRLYLKKYAYVAQDEYSQYPTLYLNFCKDFHLWDLELLLPGACYELKWSDIGKIIFAGGGKLSVKGMVFLIKGVVSTASLPFAAIYGGLKAGLSLKNLKKEMKRQGMEIASNHTYVKGTEVFSNLIDEAERQVFGEAALTYHVLYREYLLHGSDHYLKRKEVKDKVETLVNKVHETVYGAPYHLGLHIDDALGTLQYFPAIERNSSDSWRIANPEFALKKLSEANDRETREGIGLNGKPIIITCPYKVDFHQLRL